MERIKQHAARSVTTLTYLATTKYSSFPCDFPTRWYARRGTCVASCDALRLLAIQEMLNRGTRASRDEGTSSEQIETLARSYVSVDIDGSRYRRRALKRSETSWSYGIVQRCGERCWKRKRERKLALAVRNRGKKEHRSCHSSCDGRLTPSGAAGTSQKISACSQPTSDRRSQRDVAFEAHPIR